MFDLLLLFFCLWA